jgi:curved DNA-binding protein CbpA
MQSLVDGFRTWLTAIERDTYYGILNVPKAAEPSDIKSAFHAFALRCHPDQFADDSPEVRRAAAEVFKRGVEAYNVLGKPALRERYDRGLDRGRTRLDARRPTTVPPPPPVRTLDMIARTPKARAFALKADRLIAIGKLEEARLQLVNACQNDPGNAELEERIQLLYDAMALEPL